MEDYGRRPERRVFHIDSECYVVYVGRSSSDYRPFVRIGNSTELPENLKSLIYSIVVSDVFPGSPLLEQHSLDLRRSSDFRYVGDPRTVERFKSFLQHREIPSEGYQTVADESPEDTGAYVYFYEDANIRLKMDHRSVFDLSKKAKEDLHYSEGAEQVSHAWRRDPVRFESSSLEGIGCVSAGEEVYLFQNGNLISPQLETEYFRKLALLGIDPDAVGTVVAEEPGEGLVRLFKRSARTSKTVDLASANGQALRNLVELFAGAQPYALKAQLRPVSTGKWVKAGELRMRRGASEQEEELSLEYSGIRVSLYERDAEPSSTGKVRGVAIDRTERVLVATRNGERIEFPMRDGVPYQMKADFPSLDEFLDLALNFDAFSESGLMTESERQGLLLLRTAFEKIAGAAEFKRAFAELPAGLMSPRNDPQSLYPFYLKNAAVLAEIGIDSGKSTSAYRKLRALLDERLAAAPEPAAEMAHRGVLYLGNKQAYLLLEPHRSLSRSSLSHTAAARRRIRAVENQSPREFASERARLQRLIDELDTELARKKRPKPEAAAAGGATKGMTLREQAAARAEADAAKEGKKDASPKPAEAGKTASGSGTTKGTTATGGSTSTKSPTTNAAARSHSGTAPKTTPLGSSAMAVSVGRSKATGSRSSGSSRFRIVAAAAVALVVLLLLLLLARGPLADQGEALVSRLGSEPAEQEPGTPEDQAVLPDARPRDDSDAVSDNGLAGEDLDSDPSPDPVPADPDAQSTIAGGDTPDPSVEPGDPSPATDPESTLHSDQDGFATADESAGPETQTADDEITQQLMLHGITPTINDIIALTNQIAVDNGFRTMAAPKGDLPELGPDPDWIFPGNSFVLPNGARHDVMPGDTLWGIATNYLVDQLDVDFSEYLRLTSLYASQEVDEADRTRILQELQRLGEASPSEQFRSFIRERVQDLS